MRLGLDSKGGTQRKQATSLSIPATCSPYPRWRVLSNHRQARLRHTFGTHLSKNGAAPRTAQAAMRHFSLDLTMKVYTAPSLLDVAGALETLPDLFLRDMAQADAGISKSGARSHHH